MSTWNRTGPVVAEVDGSAEGLRVVDYASTEADRLGARLALIAPYSVRGSLSPMMPGYAPKTPAELAEDAVRTAVGHVRHRYGYGLQVAAATEDGTRLRVLTHAARKARMLIVGRSRIRGPQRLVNAHTNLVLASRGGCPVVIVPVSWKPSPVDHRVAVGIDGTPLSAEALEFAFGTAAARDGELVVVHAGIPGERPWTDEAAEHSWISRADHLMADTLAPWTQRYPNVPVTRFLTSRPPAAALVHESLEVGLVVVGSHAGLLPIDPVARRSVAAMTCPVAIVPHHLTAAEHEQIKQEREIVVPTS